MTLRRPTALNLGAAAVIIACVSGCSSSMEDAARQELKANPKVATPINSDQALMAALTPAPQDPETTTPAPVIPGTNTPAPLPNFKVFALASANVAPAEAEAVMKAQEQAALQTPAMPNTTSTELVTTLAPAGSAEDAEDVSVTTTLASAPAAVPSTKPTGAALAYAATPAVASFSVLDNSYDVTPPGPPPTIDPPATTGPTVLNALIKKYAALYEVPESLVHRVVHRESRYNPAAYSRGNYGLMQIRYNTAKSMGYDGPASGLFDAEKNIKYATKYLKGAWLVADKDPDGAVRLYARGYYYDAKAKGMLHLVQ